MHGQLLNTYRILFCYYIPCYCVSIFIVIVIVISFYFIIIFIFILLLHLFCNLLLYFEYQQLTMTQYRSIFCYIISFYFVIYISFYCCYYFFLFYYYICFHFVIILLFYFVIIFRLLCYYSYILPCMFHFHNMHVKLRNVDSAYIMIKSQQLYTNIISFIVSLHLFVFLLF